MGAAKTANRPMRVFDPERLNVLMTVYDECLQQLITWYSVTEPSELHGMNLTVAKRVIAAAESGIVNPEEMREVALAGLLPDSIYHLNVRPGFHHGLPTGRP
jgi:hypothetical protein